MDTGGAVGTVAGWERRMLLTTSLLVATLFPLLGFLPHPSPNVDSLAARLAVALASVLVALASFVFPALRRFFNPLQAANVLPVLVASAIFATDAPTVGYFIAGDLVAILALTSTFTSVPASVAVSLTVLALQIVYAGRTGSLGDTHVLSLIGLCAAAYAIAIVSCYVRITWLRAFLSRQSAQAASLDARSLDDRAITRLSRLAMNDPSTPIETILELTCAAVALRLGARRVAIYRWDAGRAKLMPWAAYGWAAGQEPQTVPAPLYDAIAEAVAAAKGTNPDGPAIHTVDPSDEALREIAVCTPISGSNGPAGAIAVFSSDGFVFDPRRARFVASVARIAAGAIASHTASHLVEESYARLAESQELAHIGNWARDCDVPSSCEWSAELYRILGVDPATPSELLEAAYESRVHPADRDAIVRHIDESVTLGLPYSLDHRILLPDGEVRWLEVRGRPVPDDPRRRTGIAIDVTERKLAEEALAHLASYDDLTNLPNRSKLAEVVARAATPSGVSLFFLDIDRFKTINDSLGHAVGDDLLRAVASRLITADYGEAKVNILRWGGDEFVIVVPGCERDLAKRLASHAVHLFRQPFALAERELNITVSLGVAIAVETSADAADLIRNADTAMYAAKDGGRNGFVVFADDMHLATTERLKIETNLRRAMAEGALELHYQAIVGAAHGELRGAEVLLRTNVAATSRVIAVAEETGMIAQLGGWILDRSLDQLEEWLSRSLRLKLYINISVHQLTHPEFLDRVAARIDHHPNLREYVVFELTESAMIGDDVLRGTALQRLRELGSGIAIDDFGTGYSSLAYLRRLPVTGLKLDRAFTADIATSPADRAIASAVVSVAHTLGLLVTAEGIETESQFEEVRRLGCDQVQGYHVSRPTPADIFEHRFLHPIAGTALPFPTTTDRRASS